MLAFLRAENGARIAGPEFDPFFRYTGGYGYTWFRDDAEISSFLLEADHRADIGLSEWHRESAQFYVKTQLADGTWPHRVWPHNGRLAPGWAHGRVEDGDARSVDYQADQTASVATFLATYLRLVDPDDDAVRDALITTLDGLDAVLEDDGLPGRVQNAWENMTGRFTHTAATYLEAYAAIARAPLPDDRRDHARERAKAVYEGIDSLWLDDRGRYALRLEDGELDGRFDGSTFALAAAHREYDALADVDDDRMNRLCQHVETTLDGLYRDPDGPIEGIARFEGDSWRTSDQIEPKIWTVTTAWGTGCGRTRPTPRRPRPRRGRRFRRPRTRVTRARRPRRTASPGRRLPPNSCSTTGLPTARRRSAGPTPSGSRRRRHSRRPLEPGNRRVSFLDTSRCGGVSKRTFESCWTSPLVSSASGRRGRRFVLDAENVASGVVIEQVDVRLVERKRYAVARERSTPASTRAMNSSSTSRWR